MAPIIDRGVGLIGFTYDASSPSRFGISDMVGTASDVLLGANRALHQTLTPALIRAAYLSKPVGVLSSIVEPEMVAAVVGAPSIQQYGLGDSIAITAADPTGLGVCLCAPTREPALGGTPRRGGPEL